MEKNKVPTAEEFLKLRIISKGGYVENGEVKGETQSGKEYVMKEISWIAPLLKDYAKLHVKTALEAAAEKAFAYGEGSNLTTKQNSLYWTFAGNIGNVKINKDSILNAYPEELIK